MLMPQKAELPRAQHCGTRWLTEMRPWQQIWHPWGHDAHATLGIRRLHAEAHPHPVAYWHMPAMVKRYESLEQVAVEAAWGVDVREWWVLQQRGSMLVCLSLVHLWDAYRCGLWLDT
jgi:hypothetical protein